MKLKNIKVGDTLEVKSSIVDEPLNDGLSPDMLCEVIDIELPQYDGELTVLVTFDDNNDEWVNHRHLRKPRIELTGSDLTRKMIADGETNILCYVCDDSDYSALNYKFKRTITGFSGGWFRTNGVSNWKYAVPVEKVTPLSRWRHSNGNTYAVIFITNKHSENQDRYPTTVVYRDYDGRTWSKPLSDWHRSMTEMED